MAALLTPPFWQPQDGNGKPYPGAKLNVYTAGTTTAVNIYQELALSTAHTNPVVADANGVFPLVFAANGDYKFVLTKSDDTVIYTQDDLPGILTSNGGDVAVADGGTGASDGTTARTNLGAASSSAVTDLSTDVADVKGQVDALPGGALGDAASQDTIGFAYLGSNLAPPL